MKLIVSLLLPHKPSVFSTVRVRHPIGFRSPPDQIPSATRSDSVRHPIRFRSPPDQIPFG